MHEIVHGGQLDRAIAGYGGSREDWLDLSTGVNPMAYPVPDIPDQVWQRLPDDNLMADCLEAAREYYGVPDGAQIVAGPGTQAIIQRLGGMRRGIVGPTYGEYADAMDRELGAAVMLDKLPDSFGNTDTIIACHPNNPDGKLLSTGGIARLLEAAPLENGYLVIDEAFADVAADHSFMGFAEHPNLMVLRSFGKFFGLAGMRLGFVAGGGQDLADLKTDLGSWAVPGPALYVGAKALRDRKWISETRLRLKKDARRLIAVLTEAGLEIAGGTDLFVLASTGNAAALHDALARQQVLVRIFDLDPSWVRFGLPGDDAGFDRLQRALAQARPTIS